MPGRSDFGGLGGERHGDVFGVVLDHEPSRQLWVRLFGALLGDVLGPEARVRPAVLSAAIGSVAHPFVIELDNDTVRDELRRVTRRLIFKPG